MVAWEITFTQIVNTVLLHVTRESCCRSCHALGSLFALSCLGCFEELACRRLDFPSKFSTSTDAKGRTQNFRPT